MAGKTLPTTAEVRAWATTKGLTHGTRGSLPAQVVQAWNRTHRTRSYQPQTSVGLPLQDSPPSR